MGPRIEVNVKSRNTLSHNFRLLACFLLLALAVPGCAVNGGTLPDDLPAPPPARSMEASRMGLQPALRPFHDELREYGDWVLVEPRGWVFRPRVNTVAWRPYQDGHWEPSYTFGWVWESNDPFGWITDHYGFWFHDDFQGWVWKPQGAWAPAWVAWVQIGDFVGWAPLGPDPDTPYDNVPGGIFTFVPANALAQPSAASHASYMRTVPASAGELQPIEGVASYRGVSWNAGPDLRAILGQGPAERLRLDEKDGNGMSRAPSTSPIKDTRTLERTALDALTRNAWRAGQREFRTLRGGRGGAEPGSSAPAGGAGAPGSRPDVRPAPVREPVSPDSSAAPSDTLRRARRGGGGF